MRRVLGTLALTLALLTTLPLAALVIGVSPEEIGQAIVDPDVLQAVALSLGCAALAVGLGVFLGVPAGFLLARRRVPGARAWQALFDLPLVIPHPIVGVGLLLIFGRRQLLGAALDEGLGLRVVSAVPGIVIAMLVVSSPFIVKAAIDGFRGVPLAVERTAYSLGASPARAFATVSLPLALRNIRSGALLAWARAVSEFGSIAILAYYPRTAPVLIWDRFVAHGLRAAIAPSVVLLGVCLSIFLLLQWLEGRAPTREELER